MEITLVKMYNALSPADEEDYDKLASLPGGVALKASVKVQRNIRFHRLYFSMIRTAWAYIPEDMQQSLFRNDVELFRKSVEVVAGVCDRVYNPRLKDWIDIPKSISFASMDEAEFREVYNKVREVLFEYYLQQYLGVTEFNKMVDLYY